MLRRVISDVAPMAAAITTSAHATPGLHTVAGTAGMRAISTRPLESAAAGAAPFPSPAAAAGTDAEHTTLFTRLARRFTVADEDSHGYYWRHREPTHTLFGAAIRPPSVRQLRKNEYGRKPVRAASHGASTVVGKNRVHTHADGFRAPTKAPPFPKPKFTRQLSDSKEHHQQLAQAEHEARYPELYQEYPPPRSAVSAKDAVSVTGNGPKPRPSSSPPSPAVAQSVSSATNATVGRSGAAALHAAPHRQPAMTVVVKGPAAPVRAVVKPPPMTETLPLQCDRVRSRVLAPLSLFTFSARDRMTIYASMTVALLATYTLLELLQPELVYYGVLPSSIVKQRVMATKAAAAAASATPAGASSSSHSSGSTKALAPAAAASASSSPKALSTSGAGPATKSFTRPARVLSPAHYLGIASVAIASTVPWHFFYFSTAAVLGKQAYAKRFLADWARAILPTRASQWYSRLIRAPTPMASR